MPTSHCSKFFPLHTTGREVSVSSLKPASPARYQLGWKAQDIGIIVRPPAPRLKSRRPTRNAGGTRKKSAAVAYLRTGDARSHETQKYGSHRPDATPRANRVRGWRGFVVEAVGILDIIHMFLYCCNRQGAQVITYGAYLSTGLRRSKPFSWPQDQRHQALQTT